jgi:hypothetical protein
MLASAAAAMLALSTVPAAAQGYYTVNGYPAEPYVAMQLMAMGLPFGDYWVDGYGNVGVAGGGSGADQGQGQGDGGGPWSYTPGPYTGAGTVAGDGNGCYYTAEWSNC